MATEYHITNADSFAAANWQTAAGGAGSGFVDNAVLVVEGGSVPVVNNLDWSALTVGIESLEIGTRRTGDIGTPSNPLIVDIDASSAAHLRTLAESGTTHIDASGLSGKVNNVYMAGGGGVSIYGGEASNVEMERGHFFANSSAVVPALTAFGGTSKLDTKTNSVTGKVYGGVHEINRPGTYDVYRGTLKLDIDDASGTTIRLHSPQARVEVIGDLPATVEHYAGTIDTTPSKREGTLGGTSYTRGPASLTTLVYDSRHTIGSITWIGGGGAVNIGGPTGAGI